MKKAVNPKQKGGDPSMVQQPAIIPEMKLGRPPKENRDEIVLNNGFWKWQWEWFKREAKAKNMDTMTYIRTYVAKWWIDSVEASRPGKVAVPAITDLARQLRQTWDTNVPKKSNNRKRRK